MRQEVGRPDDARAALLGVGFEYRVVVRGAGAFCVPGETVALVVERENGFARRHAVAERDDANIAVETQRLSERVDLELKPVRIGSRVAGAAGLLAMLLALVGIYGVVSYAVSQQTRDIAIRQALGATARNVVRLVLRQGNPSVWRVLVGAETTREGADGLAERIREESGEKNAFVVRLDS